MSPEQVTQTLEAIAADLACRGVHSRRADLTMAMHWDVWPALRHARWMAESAQVWVTEGKMEKAMRWLGFIQGILWMTRSASLAELRAANRTKDESSG